MNYQWWDGYRDPRFGYGSMLHGFREAVPAGVKLDEKASVDVHFGVPDSKKAWLKGTHRVCFTMWETTVLPDDFVRWLPQYDQIVVPCQHNVELFGRCHPDVTMVPLGVDRAVWSPGMDPDGSFKVLAGGSLWFRKGLDAVVAAFERAAIPDSVLEIKAAPHAFDVPKQRFPENVRLLRTWMGLEEQVDWFRSGHVYLAPSRGEGFGLMPLQAIAAGIPTIMTASTGQAEFSYLATGVVPHGQSPAHTTGLWDEPDVDALTEQLLDHHRNWTKYRKQALVNSKKSVEFTWGKAAEKLVSAVPVGKRLQTSLWDDPNVEVHARFKRKVNAHIGKTKYSFRAGETAIIPEGVFLVLSDSGAAEKI